MPFEQSALEEEFDYDIPEPDADEDAVDGQEFGLGDWDHVFLGDSPEDDDPTNPYD